MLCSSAPERRDTPAWDACQPDDRHIRTPLTEGGHVWSTMLFGDAPVFPKDDRPKEDDGPQAFLVEQSPGSVLRTHFHLEDQFQVIVGGNGRLGRHSVAAISVHYAGRHNGYGPIEAGERGLTYFTLRARGDHGAWYLPEHSDQMDRRARRKQAVGEARPVGDHSATPDGGKTTPIIEQSPDGLGAWDLMIGAGTSSPSHPGGDHAVNDRFVLLLSGVVTVDGTRIRAPGVAFLAADEHPEIHADTNARALLLQFPCLNGGTSPTRQ